MYVDSSPNFANYSRPVPYSCFNKNVSMDEERLFVHNRQVGLTMPRYNVIFVVIIVFTRLYY